ncbi:hypothetical protein MUN46_009275 [Mesosutterella sp. AGMB02718]|uniref:Uncharacterized protein n=1 Tax=Mesosutterella faecium TaxID=2925194 RepID=A0ABT7IP21_9BURK|nr:hypothetical protein [Mesosutterella sp. AGMB02718]MDL2060124.1 hypothetical protein [Mesosutterella sp. AGMB02718]
MDIRKKDSTFSLSLTEIAFTLLLLLVMLLGVLLLNKSEQLDRCVGSAFSCVCPTKPGDEAIDPLSHCEKCVSVVLGTSPEESHQIIDLGKNILAAWQSTHKEGIAGPEFERFRTDVIDYVKIRAKTLQKESTPAPQDDSKVPQTLSECKKTLEGVNSKLKYCKRAGLDVPPCWLTQEGRPQYLFEVTLLPENKVVINRAWPEERQQQVDRIPSIEALKPLFGEPIPMGRFLPIEERILQYSKTADEGQACRYFVRLRNRIPDSDSAVKARHQIEHGFYKYEIR